MVVAIYKSCPKCHSQHSKSGIFCSRTCANSRGPRTEDFKKKVRDKLLGKSNLYKGVIKIPRVEINCIICNSIILVTPKYANIKKTCGSQECKHLVCVKAGKSSASKRVLRSKDEIALFELCKAVFNDAESNSIIIDGWDADIVIPSLKYAILWHGPWHYKDMGMSNHSLIQVQNRDKIKRNLFLKHGWKVFEFKDNEYTPQTAFHEIVVEGRGYAPLP